MKPIIVIGSGMAGISLIREVRKLDTETPILLVTADDGGFYSKPMLSNAFAQNKLPAQLKTQSASQLAEQLSMTVLHHTRLEHIDTEKQSIKTSMGEFEYRDLVLATGASPIRLPIPGSASTDIISVNHLDDYANFRAKLDRVRRETSPVSIAILGAGLIGCEFADDLLQAGFEVHLIDPNSRPLAALLPTAISGRLKENLLNKGVQLHLGRSTTRVDQHEQRYRLELSDGSTLVTDLVLSAVGLLPDVSVAKQCLPNPLKCDRGILINTKGQTSAPHIYALGDCAQYQNSKDGTSSVLPYIAPLLSAARTIAKNLTSPSLDPEHEIILGPTPVIIKTPSCPIAVVPPTARDREQGNWHEEQTEEGVLICRFILNDGALAGFALTPNNANLRSELVAQLKR